MGRKCFIIILYFIDKEAGIVHLLPGGNIVWRILLVNPRRHK